MAEVTGVSLKEEWLVGQTDAEAIGIFIAGGEYPDIINGADATAQLYEAGALVPLDDYIDNYPNIKDYFTPLQWDRVRQADGHIYWIPSFNIIWERETTTEQNGEAFWIQTRVLEWDNYPEIKTMDQYFDLLERYYAANPTMKSGLENIPYTILCDDWRYFCLENAPNFLDGYPNDGSVIVDVDTKTVVDYNTTPTAKLYFQKLNEELKKGIVDKDSFTQSYDEYIAKLSTGRVLGMIDQWWDFTYSITDTLYQQKLYEEGCNYVPLSITIDGRKGHWYTEGREFNEASGTAITVSCKDVEGVMQFINDLLNEDAMTLRFWGEKGIDYEVDDAGLFYRTEEQRSNWADPVWQADNKCNYSFMPQYNGMSKDGKNTAMPQDQPSEYLAQLELTKPDVAKCFEAYGLSNYVDMLGRDSPEPGPWYPMYSHSNNMTTATPGGTAWLKMGEIKHEWLPKVVMAPDFEKTWNEYLGVYKSAKPEDFLAEMQTELDRRIALAAAAQ